MHPIERLRHVARASGAEPGMLTREAAGALAGFSDDPAGLVTACRRLVDRHPTVGPIWWLAATVLLADDPARAAWKAAQEVDDDPTGRVVGLDLPADATVAVLGWSDSAATALAARGDVRALVIDVDGYGESLCQRLAAAGSDAEEVPLDGLGRAAAVADVLLLDALAVGPTGIVATAGSRAAAAVARHGGRAVWAVGGVGRVLPTRLWDALVLRLEIAAGWDGVHEVVPADLIDVLAGPDGGAPFAEASARPDCPVAPELLKGV
jgi:hypothetical protein